MVKLLLMPESRLASQQMLFIAHELTPWCMRLRARLDVPHA